MMRGAVGSGDPSSRYARSTPSGVVMYDSITPPSAMVFDPVFVLPSIDRQLVEYDLEKLEMSREAAPNV